MVTFVLLRNDEIRDTMEDPNLIDEENVETEYRVTASWLPPINKPAEGAVSPPIIDLAPPIIELAHCPRFSLSSC